MVKIKQDTLHYLFLFGIIIKCVDGVLELLGGLALIFIKQGSIVNLIQALFQHELADDPKDWVANYLIHAAQNVSSTALLFFAVYFIVMGLIKIGLFLGLKYKKLWAHDLAAVVLSLFAIYQSVRFFSNHSIILLLLTLVDILIIILVRLEHKRLTHSLKIKQP